jgi:hypothetical protein
MTASGAKFLHGPAPRFGSARSTLETVPRTVSSFIAVAMKDRASPYFPAKI